MSPTSKRLSTEKKPRKRNAFGYFVPVCPTCGSDDHVVYIVRGLPMPEVEKMAVEGLVVLGGCLVMGDDPKWWCGTCEVEF